MALAFLFAILITGAIALVEHGPAAWVIGGISIATAFTAIYTFTVEHALLHARTTTIAVVVEHVKTKAVEGQAYSVRYRFRGSDGQEYSGKVTSSSELPLEGEMLPISYDPADPAQNLPLETFCFYRFTYTGFAHWMN